MADKSDHRNGQVVCFKDGKGRVKAGGTEFPFQSNGNFKKGDCVTFIVYAAPAGKTATRVTASRK